MAIFEYQCPSCQHKVEKLVRKMDEERFPACPKCGECLMARIISTPSPAQWVCSKGSL